MPPSGFPSSRFAQNGSRAPGDDGQGGSHLRPRAFSPMLKTMESEPFDRDMLESCRLDNERELKNVRSCPSREEIEALKRQIRTENEGREALKGHRGPAPLKMYRQPKVGRTNSHDHKTRQL